MKEQMIKAGRLHTRHVNEEKDELLSKALGLLEETVNLHQQLF